MSWTDVEKKSGEKKDKIPFTAFKTGNTLIRVLDAEPYSFWNHWMTKQNKGAVCIRKGCPICSVIANQKANKEVPTYNSSQRHAVRIWNYDTNQMEVMAQGKMFFEQLLNLHREVGNILTYDIKVTRKGDGTETTYMLLPTTPAEFKIVEGVTELDFEEFFKPMEKEQMLQLMEGKTYEEVFGSGDVTE